MYLCGNILYNNIWWGNQGKRKDEEKVQKEVATIAGNTAQQHKSLSGDCKVLSFILDKKKKVAITQDTVRVTL